MMSKTKSIFKVWVYSLVAILILALASGCSKKLMPPEIASSSGSGSQSGSMFSGDDGSGFSEDNVAGDSGAGDDGAGSGDSSGFNIQEQAESGNAGGGFFEENVGDGSGSGSNAFSDSHGSGSGSAGDDSFGKGEKFDPGTGSDGFFASPGTGSDGSGSGGSGGSGDVMGSGGSMGGDSGGGGSMGDEARLLTFQPTSDLQDIQFNFDKYDLTEDSKQVLQQNAEWLKSNPSTRVEIQGHCDERGTNNYNLGLGERRAISTKKYLMALGVDERRIFTISYGEEKPFCFESSEACWGENRRAHFMVAQ